MGRLFTIPGSPPITIVGMFGSLPIRMAEPFYALYALPEGETLPAVIEWEGNVPERGTSVRLLSTGQRMKWIERDGKVAVTLPAKLAGSTEPIALQFDTPLPKQNKK